MRLHIEYSNLSIIERVSSAIESALRFFGRLFRRSGNIVSAMNPLHVMTEKECRAFIKSRDR